MSKIKWNERKIQERYKAGHGEGILANYKPWLEVKDFSSRGRSRRAWSNKTERFHHLFSDVEHDIFTAAEWSLSVIDIREQYPLDRELTQTIAQQLKIRHPHYPGTQVPTVMTVDFLLTIITESGESYVGLNAKRDEEAENENSLNKLEIQRRYFEQLDIPHHLIYHSQLPIEKIKNISWIRDAQIKPEEMEPHPGFYHELMRRMAHDLPSSPNKELTLAAYCSAFDQRFNIELGTGIRIARMLLQERTLCVDLDLKNLITVPLKHIRTNPLSSQIKVSGGFDAL